MRRVQSFPLGNSARCAFSSLLMMLPMVAAAAEPLGQGATTCAAYLELVDGNWQHPLNALNFHGYVSWALGYVSASDTAPAALREQEALKLALVDYCREHPEVRFGAAVAALIGAP